MSQRRKIPPDYIADTLGITVEQLRHMAQGEVQWSASQRKRVVEAVDRYGSMEGHDMTDQREPWPQWTSKGAGEPCPRCKRPMERRQRDRPPAWFSGYWHTEWGHCGVCPYQVFYPGFERRQDYLANGRRHRVVREVETPACG